MRCPGIPGRRIQALLTVRSMSCEAGRNHINGAALQARTTHDWGQRRLSRVLDDRQTIQAF